MCVYYVIPVSKITYLWKSLPLSLFDAGSLIKLLAIPGQEVLELPGILLPPSHLSTAAVRQQKHVNAWALLGSWRTKCQSSDLCSKQCIHWNLSWTKFSFRFLLDRLYDCTFNFSTLSSTTHNLLLTPYNALSILYIELLYLEIWCGYFVFKIGPSHVAFQVDLKLMVFLLQPQYCHDICVIPYLILILAYIVI